MRNLLYFIFISLGLFIGCSDEAELNPNEEINLNHVESRNSKDDASSVVPLEVASEIALKYPSSEQASFINDGDSRLQRDIEGSHVLRDKEGVPALYVFTYQDNLGYVVVSADWRHEPICAITKKGTYPDSEAPSMLFEWFDATIENVEFVRYAEFENSKRARKAWKEIDDDLDIQALRLIDDECCEECPNFPECEFDPRIGCGGNSQELCDGVNDDNPCGNWTYTTVGPLMDTEWGQECSYNNLCVEEECNEDLLDCPDNCSDNPLTGCVATAMAQIIRYWEIATAHGYNYSSMPNSSGNAEVQQLMYDAGCSVDMDWGCDSSGAKGSKVPGALKNEFDFSTADRDSYGSGNYQTVVSDISSGRPVLFEGCRTKKTTLGIFHRYSNCHEWVCDGYSRRRNQCYSYLQLHMNWGWNGNHNGFFSFNNWKIAALNRNYQYSRDYVHDIKP